MSEDVRDGDAATGAEPLVIEGQAASRSPGGIPIQCQFCVGRNFRRSRWRKGDFKQLLLMRYPVRCLRCSQRQWVSFSVAGISIPSHAKHVPERAATVGHAGRGSGARDRAGAGEGSR